MSNNKMLKLKDKDCTKTIQRERSCPGKADNSSGESNFSTLSFTDADICWRRRWKEMTAEADKVSRSVTKELEDFRHWKLAQERKWQKGVGSWLVHTSSVRIESDDAAFKLKEKWLAERQATLETRQTTPSSPSFLQTIVLRKGASPSKKLLMTDAACTNISIVTKWRNCL